MPFVDSALGLARRGFRVFPLEPGAKIPVYAFAWKDLASSDVSAIRSWWRQHPDANIGVATGHGLLVIDADCKVKAGVRERGLESLALLDDLGLPEGFRVRTASGGIHVYLRVGSDVGLTVGAKDLPGYPGLDFRCEGGYVVGPGSIVGGVAYRAL